MLNLINEKKKQIKRLQHEVEDLQQQIQMSKLKETYKFMLDTWYKTSDPVMFFRPTGFNNEFEVVGVSIKLHKDELAYNLDDDSFNLEYALSKMQTSSYGEMLNTVNLHNLKVLEQYK